MNKGFRKTRLLLVLTVAVVGALPPQEGLATSTSRSTTSCSGAVQNSTENGSLLEYFGRLQAASGGEQARQHFRTASAAKCGKSRGKLMLALTLIIPETPFADFARAKKLLEEYLHDAENEESDDKNLAMLMVLLLDEITRLDEQLDQLKAIEKDITETEQSVNVPTPAPDPSPAVNDELEEEDTTSR